MIAPGRWAAFWAVDRKVIRLIIDGHAFDLSPQEAEEIRHGLEISIQRSIEYGDPVPATDRAPIPPEPVTKPATPIPIKRASGEHRLTLPHGIQAEVDAILEEGKGPPK